MNKKLKIILVIVLLLLSVWQREINQCTQVENLIDNSNLLYIRDLELKILHNKDCRLVAKLENFGTLFTTNGYKKAILDGYIHCEICDLHSYRVCTA